MTTCPYGFRIVGATCERRRLVDAAAAFAGYAACDPRAELEREAYLSAFWFGNDFGEYLADNGTVAGYRGTCWAPLVWFDIDRDGELDKALADTRRLAAFLDERYGLDDGELLAFYSGSKGFHLALPTALWLPEPSSTFNAVCRRFAKSIAERAHVGIDCGVYSTVQAFRAPNSRHPKTGLHKRRLAFDELSGLKLAGIQRLAEAPEPFELPDVRRTCPQAIADWHDAEQAVERQHAAIAERRAAGDGNATLNRLTFDFIRNGAPAGGDGVADELAGRHRRLFSAAANLADFGCPPALAHALLTEAGLDSGLPPREVHRQIECGLAHRQGGAP
ncbi:MAG: DNA primase [Pirellulales bacterium]